MPRRNDDLTFLEQAAMLAILRLRPSGYGVNIRDEIEKRAGKSYGYGAVYTVLERLEERGFIEAREGEVTAARGGRRKTYFDLTEPGAKTLQASLNAIESLRRGAFALKGA